MDNIKEKTMEHFNKTAETYDQTSDGKFVFPMYESLLRELSQYSNGKLLDVGCGNGNVLAALEDTKIELYGIDLSENMINEAKNRLGSNVDLCIGDAEKLPYQDDYFDVVVCNASFHHYPNPEVVLKDMHRVLKKGAKLLIGEGYVIQPLRALLNLSFRFSDSGDYHSYGKRELRDMFKHCGFELGSVKKTGDHSVLYIASAT